MSAKQSTKSTTYISLIYNLINDHHFQGSKPYFLYVGEIIVRTFVVLEHNNALVHAYQLKVAHEIVN